MRTILLLTALLMGQSVFAGDKKIDFNYKMVDLNKVLDDYSHATGQKFIVDPGVHAMITIINSGPVSTEEAFNQLSTALALNGVGFSTRDDAMVLMQARALQRSMIGVGTQLPPMKPEKMYTWMPTLKYVSADDVNRQLRILTSKDGELVPVQHNNSLIISDWSSNLYRIAAILKEVDVPAGKTVKSELPPMNFYRHAGSPPPHFNSKSEKKSEN
jgi:type II secretory pathway component GspD/PulD (secretin)